MNRFAFVLLILSHCCLGQGYFSDAFHLAENASEVADVVLAVEDTIVIATADLCGLPANETSCVRILKFITTNDELELVQERSYDFGNSHGKAVSNYFVNSNNGGYIYGANHNDQWRIMKLDETLDSIWTVTKSGTSVGVMLGMQEDINGNLLLAGFENPSPNVGLPLGVLLNANGELIWTKTYSNDDSDSFYSSTVGMDGSYVFSGYVNYFLPLEDYGLSNGYIVRTDAEGNELQRVIVEGLAIDGSDDPENTITSEFNERDGPIHIYTHPLGGYVFHQDLGNYHASFPFLYIGRVVRLDSELNTLWEIRFDDNERRDQINNIEILEDGSIIGCGFTDNGPEWGSYGWVFKLSPEGELMWRRIIAHPIPHVPNTHRQFFRDIVEMPNGDIVLVGSAAALPNDFMHLWIVKVDGDGCLMFNCNEDVIYSGLEEISSSPTFSSENIFRTPTIVIGNEIDIEFLQPINSDNVCMQLSDLTGRVCLKSPIANWSERHKMHIGSVQNGIYILSLFSNGEMLQSVKLVR